MSKSPHDVYNMNQPVPPKERVMSAKQKIKEMFCIHRWKIIATDKGSGIPSYRKCLNCNKYQRSEHVVIDWVDMNWDFTDYGRE